MLKIERDDFNARQMEKLSMDLNSQPDTVWMCLREEGRLVQKSQLLFRRILSDEEYVKLVGVRAHGREDFYLSLRLA